ncbi:MAG: efflux RND transporter periplasmic adaptor subunit [Polyangiaceae bacterium]|jgi:membrane fusion protein, multidrug efflux system
MTPPPPHGDGSEQSVTSPNAGHELGFDLPAAAPVSKARAAWIVLGALVVLGAAFAAAFVPKQRERAALADATQVSDSALLRVEVVTPKLGSSDKALSLPGSVQPLEETVLYARASGYIRKWFVDIGDKAKEGQLLADVETPELDQELDQARAQLLQAQAALVQSRANRELSKANLQRYKQLIPAGVVSQADLDQRQAQAQVDEATVSVSQAAIAAQEANIRRLTQLKSFSHVTAPFAGTITQRWVENGALVTAGNGQPLYKIAAMDPARVFIQVPQDVAPSIRADVPAKVMVREYPGRPFDGKISRAAGELDPTTRTMNTEVRVPNADGALIAGMYAEVALTLPLSHRVFELPSTALITDAKGVRVAIVDADSKIHLVPVVVERDTGPTIELASGLTGGERVAKLGSAAFSEGRPVEVIH